MEVNLYKIGSSGVIGYCGGIISGANPAASAVFVITSAIVYSLAIEILGSNATSSGSRHALSHLKATILCSSAAIGYHVALKLVAAISMEALWKISLFSSAIVIVSQGGPSGGSLQNVTLKNF